MTMGRDSLLWNTLLVLLAGGGMLALLRSWAPSRIGRWVPPETAESLGAMRLQKPASGALSASRASLTSRTSSSMVGITSS